MLTAGELINVDGELRMENSIAKGLQVELDPWRQPVQVITFAGIRPGDRVADFMSGNGYFTRVLSKAVGTQGRVYAFLPAQELANCAPEESAGTKALELRDTDSLHRIDPETIRSEVTAAGFIFESQSEALRNAQDTHGLPVFYQAIRHRTDQVILKFRKPKAGS